MTWVIFGLIIYACHSFSSLRFGTKILKYCKKNILYSAAFAIFNASLFYFCYHIKLDYHQLYAFLYAAYYLEFRLLSKTSKRQLWVLSASYVLNVVAVHLLILVITSVATGQSYAEIYANQTTFFQTVFIAHFLLFMMLNTVRILFSLKKLIELSMAPIYSEIISCAATLLYFVIVYDSWFLTHSVSYERYTMATICTVLFVLALFFLLLVFNYSLVQLHPYKRKADEAKFLQGMVAQKKINAEFKLNIDDLTKLYNRRFIFNKLDDLCGRTTQNFGVIYADLASLKSVNDLHGHKAGDRYITSVADCLKMATRDDDYCARVGGDEFLIILNDVSEEILQMIVERIGNLISIIDSKEPFTIHANLGSMCFLAEEVLTRSEVVEKVDQLMKKDKIAYYQKGGN